VINLGFRMPLNSFLALFYRPMRNLQNQAGLILAFDSHDLPIESRRRMLEGALRSNALGFAAHILRSPSASKLAVRADLVLNCSGQTFTGHAAAAANPANEPDDGERRGECGGDDRRAGRHCYGFRLLLCFVFDLRHGICHYIE
jgi:hypothetical protein